jgi:predicted dehydrogenase
MAKDRPLRLALLGSGEQAASVLAPALYRLAQAHGDKLELARVCAAEADLTARLCKEFGFQAACEDAAAVVREKSVDACICATAAELAAVEIPQLLAAKMPCLLTVPLGEDLSDVLAMSEAVRQHNTPHAVALPRRFNPYLTRGLKWARQLGEIRSIRATLATQGELDRPFFWNAAVHAMDVAAFVHGRVEKHSIQSDEKADDRHSVSLHFATQTTGQLELRGHAEVDVETYEFQGEGFLCVVALRGPAPSLVCWRGPRVEVKIPASQSPADAEHDGAAATILDFIENIRAGTKPGAALDDVLPILDVALQLSDSLQPAGSL